MHGGARAQPGGVSISSEPRQGSIGPVEYMLIEFPGNNFRGEIAPAIADLVDRGLVRILDLVFVLKDSDGDVAIFEYDEREDLASLAVIEGAADGVLNDEDVRMTADTLAPNTSALLVVWEDRWATPLAEAIRAAGGVLRDGARIPHEIAEAALVGTEG